MESELKGTSTKKERSRSSSRSPSIVSVSSGSGRSAKDEIPISSFTNSTDPKLVMSRVFVGNVPTERITRTEMEERFNSFGRILGLSMHRGFAFIQFTNQQDALKCVRDQHNTSMKGKTIDVRLAADKGKKQPMPRRRSISRDRRFPRGDSSPRRSRSPRNLSRSPGRRSRSPHRSKSPRRLPYPKRRSFSRSPVRRFDDIRNERPTRDDRRPQPRREPRGKPKDIYWNLTTAQLAKYLPEPRPNDCEIIVLNQQQRAFAESIEVQLKSLGLFVDLLFPNVDTPISQVLDDITQRGCLYSIVITPQNEVHYSSTLNILYGTPQEHRNMPLDICINFIEDDFREFTIKRKSRELPPPVPPEADRIASPTSSLLGSSAFPEDSVPYLLQLLLEGKYLRISEIDRLIEYLKDMRSKHIQDDHGGVYGNLITPTPDPQKILQQQILSLFKPQVAPVPAPAPEQFDILRSAAASLMGSSLNRPPPQPVPAPVMAPNPPPTRLPDSVSSLLNNPSLQMALNNLMKNGSGLKGNRAEPPPIGVPPPTRYPLTGTFFNKPL